MEEGDEDEEDTDEDDDDEFIVDVAPEVTNPDFTYRRT